MRSKSRPSRRRAFHETLERAALDLRSAFGGRDYKRFVIVGVARTGSTLLINLLNAQRQVIAFGELFRGDGAIGWDVRPFLTFQPQRLARMQAARPLDFLDTAVFRKWPADTAAVGFKLFYYHARSHPQAQVWSHLRDDPHMAIIHIKRLNILEQFLSLRVAHATNVWSASSTSVQPTEPMRLCPDDCLKHFEEVRAQEEECDAFFAGRQVLTLTYEDLIADRVAAMGRVGAHLGVSFGPVEARTVRQRTQPLSSAIANYDELRDFFAGSAWEGFFSGEDTVATGPKAA